MSCNFVRNYLMCALAFFPGLSWALTDLPIAVTSLDLREAIARTLERSPELRTYSPARRAAEAERLQAGLRPNPELGATLENFAGTGEARGSQILETTLVLSQLIELGGKRAYRYGAADAALGTLNADYVVARLDALAETARRFTDVAQAQAKIEIANRAVTLAEGISNSVERRIRAGAASTAERNRVAVALIRARLDLQEARAERDARNVALASTWGATSADFDSVRANLEQLPPLMPLAPLLEQLKESPAFSRFVAERRLREAELKLARAQAVPNLTLGLGVRRLSATNDYSLVASLNVPLPVYNRNQGEIAAASARIELNDVQRDAAQLRIGSVIFGLYQEAVQARVRATTVQQEAIPQAEQALVLIERGFGNGRFSFLELADAQRQVLELREQAIAAFADAHRLDVEIERLTGQPIATSTPIPGEPR